MEFFNDIDHSLIENYAQAKLQLPQWLKMGNNFNAEHESIGFLIIHQGQEGIFYLINWWVGKNMINSHIFFTPLYHASTFRRISGDGLISCIWEMEVINHERLSWTKHVLKSVVPDYQAYLNDQLNGSF